MSLDTNVNFVFAELLPLILENSTTSDLIEYRLVSQQWKHVATQTLLKRGSLKVHFQLDRWPCKNNPTFYSYKPGVGKPSLCYRHEELKSKILTDMDMIGDRTLANFLRLVTSLTPHQIASSLPVSNFGFALEFGNKRNQPQLLSFLQNYGPKIKALTLDNYDEYFVGHKGMPNYLLQYTRNLESLHIHDDGTFSKDPSEQILMDKRSGENWNVTLSRLKYIEVGNWLLKFCAGQHQLPHPDFKTLSHLLEVAPGLQRVSFQSVNDPSIVKVFLPSRIDLVHIRMLAISAKNLFFQGLESLECLAKIMTQSQRGVGLQQLQICVGAWPPTRDIWKRGSAALREILEANVNSLKEIQLRDGAASILHKIPGLPSLPNVTKLAVCFRYHTNFLESANPDDVLEFVTSYDGSSPRNSLPRLFPNLDTVDLSIWNWQDENIAKRWFPFWEDRLMTVKTLKTQPVGFSFYDNDVSVAYAMSLKLCPEISSFETVWPYCELPEIVVQSTLTQLTNLHLNFTDSDRWYDDTFLDVDAALTGLSKETVSVIYSNWLQCSLWELPQDEEAEKLQLTRVNPSLLNLPNLKKLTLELHIRGRPTMLISGVSAKFGFDLIKNLEVSVMLNVYGKVCPGCDQEERKAASMKLHQPLLSFPNVKLGTN